MRPIPEMTPVLHRIHSLSMTSIFLLFIILVISFTDAIAQRITYETLRMRDRQPNTFLEHLVIPDSTFDNVSLVSSFRIEHNFLSFRRYRGSGNTDQSRQFYAEPLIRVNIREFDKNLLQDSDRRRELNPDRTTRRGRARDRDSRPDRDIPDLQGNVLESMSWSETVYSETYEQTKSSGMFVQDIVKTPIAPGRYTIEASAISDNRTRRGITPRFRVADPNDGDIAYFYFLDQQTAVSPPFSSPLMNMGRNVFFGRDHQIAMWIPKTSDEAEYKLEIHQLQVQQRDTTVQDRVLELNIDKNNLLTNYYPSISQKNGRPHFELRETQGANSSDGALYVAHIPNSTFENAHFRVRLIKTLEGEEKIIARKTYQSLWLDMPISLLNIDVAINMMQYIMEDDQHRTLRRGSRTEKERRFREFWSERDPSPDKEYNELMVEYFRRIDHAFDNFTTPQKPGYESDQGKVYIRNGEPDRKVRTFPANQPAREVWHYNGREFVFEATSGFGDYQLVERR